MAARGGSAAARRSSCGSYDPARFPPFAVTVDLAVFTIRAGVLAVLLVQRPEHPYRGTGRCPAGSSGKTRAPTTPPGGNWPRRPERSTLRGHLEQLRTYSDPGRDPRMRVVSVAHVALAPDLPDPRPGGDAAAARWWPVEDLPAAEAAPAPLRSTTRPILADALERVRSKLEYTTLAASFVTEPFTIADLRRVYAAVWGQAPDLANFRRKVLGTPGFVDRGRSGHRQPPQAPLAAGRRCCTGAATPTSCIRPCSEPGKRATNDG